MFEKVNPCHPDKVADRIAGAIVDLAYKETKDPRVAVEVLLGHGQCHVIVETSACLNEDEIDAAVKRIAGTGIQSDIVIVPQDHILSDNQDGTIRCGDNGIFKGLPITNEERDLSNIAHSIYRQYWTDGKYILDGRRLIICQSHASHEALQKLYPSAEINPLGFWTGGTNVDSGATNRKLGSDMAGAVTGGGLHGKDLSKADVTLNIYAHIRAQELGKPVEICCAIGDEYVDGRPYGELVEIARKFIKKCGGFEKFAEWGLV